MLEERPWLSNGPMVSKYKEAHGLANKMWWANYLFYCLHLAKENTGSIWTVRRYWHLKKRKEKDKSFSFGFMISLNWSFFVFCFHLCMLSHSKSDCLDKILVIIFSPNTLWNLLHFYLFIYFGTETPNLSYILLCNNLTHAAEIFISTCEFSPEHIYLCLFSIFDFM